MNTLTQNFPQDLYRVVMDSSVNPLAALPKMVRFQQQEIKFWPQGFCIRIPSTLYKWVG